MSTTSRTRWIAWEHKNPGWMPKGIGARSTSRTPGMHGPRNAHPALRAHLGLGGAARPATAPSFNPKRGPTKAQKRKVQHTRGTGGMPPDSLSMAIAARRASKTPSGSRSMTGAVKFRSSGGLRRHLGG